MLSCRSKICRVLLDRHGLASCHAGVAAQSRRFVWLEYLRTGRSDQPFRATRARPDPSHGRDVSET
ncbi:hypothetical protein roselon_00083 [Roseibacterium elongatum DSM 19469]|uniref:Uncharacterized protein n=1 Tax=Roseicyclus elongatus DSM 19469 TaxID=1294273 RepID=W8RNH1_9RHOB|nr:hypothetical protein roselon_00083 [Roseibacterium elongatum DSM 19469]